MAVKVACFIWRQWPIGRAPTPARPLTVKRAKQIPFALLLPTDPQQELPRRHRTNAADGPAEITRDFRGENPLPKEPDEIACEQHHCECDQQSLPKWHRRPPTRSFHLGRTRHLHDLDMQTSPARSGSLRNSGNDKMLTHEAPYHAVSMTGSRPTSRASWRSRTNTRSPASALKPFSKRKTNRPRSTTIGVFGNTPVVEAETR